jgi:hypothetical protein
MIKEHLAVEYFGQSKESIEKEHLKNRLKISKMPAAGRKRSRIKTNQ